MRREMIMRRASAMATLIVLMVGLSPRAFAASDSVSFESRAAVMDWIDGYRHKPQSLRLSAAVKILSENGSLREPETAGYDVGFVAGVLGANPHEAEGLANEMLPLPASDQWLVVRALAYSGLPAWKTM